jgi:uncharacterized membrane protein YeaQ/YmgE (transglycosylase-associated protein family)
MELLWFTIIGVTAGWLAGRLMRGNGLGVLADVAAGVTGAFAGGYLWPALPIGNVLIGRMLVALIGAVVLLVVVRSFSGRRLGRRLWS